MTSFFAFPAEIRNRIYELALVQDAPIDLQYQHRPFGMSGALQPSQNLTIDVALATTCRQISAEALPITYGRNVFVFNLSILTPTVDENRFIAFRQRLGALNTSRIKHFELRRSHPVHFFNMGTENVGQQFHNMLITNYRAAMNANDIRMAPGAFRIVWT